MEIRPILSALMRSKTGAILVALQVAISLAILANALHIVNVRQAVATRPSGIGHEEQVLHIAVRHLVKSSTNEQYALQKQETAALRAVSGVTSAAFTDQFPLSQSGMQAGLTADRKQTTASAVASMYYSPDSLVQTWQMTLAEGRDFRPEEFVEGDQNADAIYSPPSPSSPVPSPPSCGRMRLPWWARRSIPARVTTVRPCRLSASSTACKRWVPAWATRAKRR